jgi:hypothetical protein
MKSGSGSAFGSELVDAAATYGRFTTTVGFVVAVFFALVWIIVGVAAVSNDSPFGFAMIAVGLLIGILSVVYYRAVTKSRRVAAVVGAWNLLDFRGGIPGGRIGPAGIPGALLPPYYYL